MNFNFNNIKNKVVQLTSNRAMTLALLDNGRITGWGPNNIENIDYYNDLNFGFNVLNPPLSVQGNAKKIALNLQGSAIAILNNGSLTGWGFGW